MAVVSIIGLVLVAIFAPGKGWNVEFKPVKGKQVKMIGVLDNEHHKIIISKVEE